jgi:hypothetical protein
LTDGQMRAQLETFIAQHSLPKGMGTIFYLLTPPGVTVCLDGGGAAGHCSDFAGDPSEIAAYEEARANYPGELSKYEREIEEYPAELIAWEKALAKYEREKQEKEEKKEPFEATAPVEPKVPVEPVEPVEPAAYAAYKDSFCSYHSDINPDSAERGDGSTVLYAVLPWTAGGAGDYYFESADRAQGSACQDGGFQPGTKPLKELQEKEREKPRSRAEQEAFEAKTKQEQREIEEAAEEHFEKAHEQEPNQLGEERGPDGYWDHGLADLIVNQLAVEQQNTVTDPLLNGWQDSAGSEVTDECRNSFFAAKGSATANLETRAGTLFNQTLGEEKYYLNDAYNLAATMLPSPAIPCLKEIALVPKFTAPSPVGAGEVVGFDGMESNISLDADPTFTAEGAKQTNYALFTWNFGDGSPTVTGYAPGAATQNSADSPCNQPWMTPCAASAFHSYQYGGTYDVTLTVTDVGGNTASISKAVTVIGPSPPSATSGSGGATGSSGTAGTSSTGAAVSSSTTGSRGSGAAGGAATAGGASAGAPTIAESAPSRSLSKAIHSGLALRYTVNQQVAGRVEALLAASTASHLRIKGPLATGLPQGYPREIVVGRAVLVTTRAGQGTIKVKFSKLAAKRLAKVHRLELTLRFVLRSATPMGVRTTSMLSTVVLSH